VEALRSSAEAMPDGEWNDDGCQEARGSCPRRQCPGTETAPKAVGGADQGEKGRSQANPRAQPDADPARFADRESGRFQQPQHGAHEEARKGNGDRQDESQRTYDRQPALLDSHVIRQDRVEWTFPKAEENELCALLPCVTQ